MGKRRAPLTLSLRDWQQLVGPGGAAALQTVLTEGRQHDLLQALAAELQPPAGILHAQGDAGLRLALLGLMDERGAELCADAPTDLLRQLYETLRDRAAVPGRDGAAGTVRLRVAALRTLTRLLVRLDVPQRDARLAKVHVEALFRLAERAGPHADTPPELSRAAAGCLRAMEEGAPTLLLTGARQLLELARREAGSAAAESFTALAATVLAHGAARCLACRGDDACDGAALEASDAARRGRRAEPCCVNARALALGAAAADEDSSSGCVTPAGARDISPSGTLDTMSHHLVVFASGRTATSSEGVCSPPEAPDSPRGVASLAGAASTQATTADGSASAAPGAHALDRLVSLTSSGSVQLDGGAPVALLSPAGPGLRHFRVPQHLAWPDALAAGALCVTASPDALDDLRRAALEFLAALPRMGVEGVAAVTAALPPILRLAALPAEQLRAELDSLLRSGSTLMLQAALKLHGELGEGLGDCRPALESSVLQLVNGPHPAEQRIVAATWCLVQHHAQLHARRPSLFSCAWRAALPRPSDPAQLLSLKVKSLSACLAVGIGRADEICAHVFAWDGFWVPRPSDQQQRLAQYSLRMLGSATASYAAAVSAGSAALASARGDHDGGEAAPPASPQHVMACLAAACMQLVATRRQLLPAVEAFLANCGACCPDLQLTLLNSADALLSAAAAGTFSSLQARRGGDAPAPQAQRSRGAARDPGSPPSPRGGGSPTHAIAGMLQRLSLSVSKRFSQSDGPGSPQQTAEDGQPPAPASPRLGAPLPMPALAAPQPPPALKSWEEAEAWLWDSRTWTDLSANMHAHDPLAFRSLLLRLAQHGAAVLPMGALRLLAAYARQYQGEQPGHALPAKEAGNCVLAICQAAAMTHLLVGPAGATAPPPAKPARCGASDGGAAASPRAAPADGAATPQWTLQQEEVAAAMQAVLACLTSRFPVESVRARAQSFLDLLANPAAWDLRLRVGTMAKLLGGYVSDAVSIASYI